MHRALGRVIRGTCRKWRENDVPSIAGEEVRKNQDKEKFVPPRHSLHEALGWTTGLVITYEVAHRRRTGFFNNCPFVGIATTALTQPVSLSTASHIKPYKSRKASEDKSVVPKRTSIDRSPFLKESWLDNEESGISTTSADDISFRDSFSSTNTLKSTEESREKSQVPVSVSPNAVKQAKKVAGDTLSVLGCFQYLQGKKPLLHPDPGVSAIELLKKGEEYGSSRALFNLGIIYERQEEKAIAAHYYQRAADLGHPLASYNLGVFKMNEGLTTEALRHLNYANECGVPEAGKAIRKISSRIPTSVALILQTGD